MSEEKTIKQQAQEYETTTTKNVADLDRFDVNMTLHTYEGIDSDGAKFSYKYIEDKDGTRYRVPWPVIAQLKDYIEDNPDQSLFKVKKSGEGLKTRYTVLPTSDEE